MFAIREDQEYVNQEDLTKAARKVGEVKKHGSEFFTFTKCHYYPSDPEPHYSKDGVFNVTFSMMYIPLLLSYLYLCMPLNFAMFFPVLLCYLATIKPLQHLYLQITFLVPILNWPDCSYHEQF